jgi:hypothetical protein
VKKDLKDKKGSIGFGAENFFTNEFKIRSELNAPNIEQKGLNVMRNMSFRVNFSYRIGKMSVDAKPRRRRSINNDDLKDGGDGGGGMEGGAAPAGGGGGGQQRRGNAPAATSTNGAARPASILPAPDASAVVNIEGSWTYTVESPQGGEGDLVIKKENGSYTGYVSNKRFNKETPLSSVTLSGNELTYQYETPGQGGTPMVVKVRSIVGDDQFTGEMTVGEWGTFPIKGTKAK